MARNKRDDLALTPDEVSFLRSNHTPDSVKQYLSRQHDSLGVRTSAFQKVAAAARAERNAIMEVALLSVVQAAAGQQPNHNEAPALAREREQLLGQIAEMEKKVERVTATPAMIHSDG